MSDIGRPPKFKTALDIQIEIDEYFSQTLADEMPFTITGLAYHLGFESRQSIYDYEKHGEFSYAIKRARLQVEKYAEDKLFSTTPTGAIFALKNHGWSDKQEIEHSGEMNINIGEEFEGY